MKSYKTLVSRSLVVFSALIVTACGGGGGGGGSSSSCDVLGANSGRVTGGEQCEGGESPVVAILFQDRDGTEGICSGTLISLTTVLTAGHCLDNAIAAVVFTQEDVLAQGGEVLVHPNWLLNPTPGNPFDIAMLRISTPKAIGPVPILFSDDIAVGEGITVFGFGLDENQAVFIDRLRNGEAPLKAGNMTINAVGQGLFTAAFDSTGSAICQGDSGGPVVQVSNGVSSLIGVTSYTVGGCTSGSISGFINLQRADLIDFITSFAPDAAVR
jgi:S1-C subfamily serine protease